MKQYTDISIDDFQEALKTEYNIVKIDRTDIIAAARDSGLYYDSIMEKIYLNEDYYYAEFDD